jgi:hypothetical protein
MSNRFSRTILFLFLTVIPWFCGITVFASGFSVVDSSHVEVRFPDPKFEESFKSQKEFNYSLPPIKTNLFDQLIEYLKDRWGSLEKISAIIPWILKLIFLALVLFFLFIVITKTRIYRIFYSDQEVDAPEFKISKTDFENEDLDELIRKFVAEEQFRQAVRVLYLKVISLLRAKEYIHFSKEKTNIDYLHDLKNDELKTRFYAITSIYNHVWYGDAEIAEEQFEKFEERFQSFYTAIDVQE